MSQIILGIDPGSRITGYGLIRLDNETPTHLEHGALILPAQASLETRLRVLAQKLREIFVKFDVQVAVVERIFLGKNADSAFKLGHARGVCLLALAEADVTLVEYAARFVKKAVTGSGSASKDQVRLWVMRELKLTERQMATQADASDALALALAHTRGGAANQKLQQMLQGELR